LILVNWSGSIIKTCITATGYCVLQVLGSAVPQQQTFTTLQSAACTMSTRAVTEHLHLH